MRLFQDETDINFIHFILSGNNFIVALLSRATIQFFLSLQQQCAAATGLAAVRGKSAACATPYVYVDVRETEHRREAGSY